MNVSSCPSLNNFACGAVTSEGTDHLVWAGPGIANGPKASELVNVTLGFGLWGLFYLTFFFPQSAHKEFLFEDGF